jgi:hypothetical protein
MADRVAFNSFAFSVTSNFRGAGSHCQSQNEAQSNSPSKMISARKVIDRPAAQSMRCQSGLNLSNAASKDCFATEFIVNPVNGTIKVLLLVEDCVGK